MEKELHESVILLRSIDRQILNCSKDLSQISATLEDGNASAIKLRDLPILSIETQLTILKRIEDQANQTRFLSMGSLATLIAILVVLGAKL